nr:hypothetical protein GCM10020093_052770 [Planobispora longispora]
MPAETGVQITRASPSGAAQTAVGTAAPFLRKVVTETYGSAASSGMLVMSGNPTPGPRAASYEAA